MADDVAAFSLRDAEVEGAEPGFVDRADGERHGRRAGDVLGQDHEVHHQLGETTVGVEPPVAGVPTVAETAGDHDRVHVGAAQAEPGVPTLDEARNVLLAGHLDLLCVGPYQCPRVREGDVPGVDRDLDRTIGELSHPMLHGRSVRQPEPQRHVGAAGGREHSGRRQRADRLHLGGQALAEDPDLATGREQQFHVELEVVRQRRQRRVVGGLGEQIGGGRGLQHRDTRRVEGLHDAVDPPVFLDEPQPVLVVPRQAAGHHRAHGGPESLGLDVLDGLGGRVVVGVHRERSLVARLQLRSGVRGFELADRLAPHVEARLRPGPGPALVVVRHEGLDPPTYVILSRHAQTGQATSNRSLSMTLTQARTKSCTNFSSASALA